MITYEEALQMACEPHERALDSAIKEAVQEGGLPNNFKIVRYLTNVTCSSILTELRHRYKKAGWVLDFAPKIEKGRVQYICKILDDFDT